MKRVRRNADGSYTIPAGQMKFHILTEALSVASAPVFMYMSTKETLSPVERVGLAAFGGTLIGVDGYLLYRFASAETED